MPMSTMGNLPLPTDTAAILDLLKARGAIAERLSQNADFRTLQVLDTMIAGLRHEIAEAAEAAETKTTEEGKPKKGPLSDFSHADGAFKLLDQFKRAIPVTELVRMMAANGLVVGGKDPPINLSSTLSKDGRFESIRHEGRACWWLKGRALPEEETADARPAA